MVDKIYLLSCLVIITLCQVVSLLSFRLFFGLNQHLWNISESSTAPLCSPASHQLSCLPLCVGTQCAAGLYCYFPENIWRRTLFEWWTRCVRRISKAHRLLKFIIFSQQVVWNIEVACPAQCGVPLTRPPIQMKRICHRLPNQTIRAATTAKQLTGE